MSAQSPLKFSFGLIAVCAIVSTSFVNSTDAQLRKFRWIQPGCGPCQSAQKGCGCQGCQQADPCQGCGSVSPGQSHSGQPTPADPSTPGDPATPNTGPGDGGAANNIGADAFAMSDQFGGGESIGARDITIGDFFNNSSRFTGTSFQGLLVNNPIAAGDRRFKVSDHFSPLPVNRIFITYHNFDDPVTDINGNIFDVQRYTMGLERTFWQDIASFEVRIPFAHGLNRSQVQDQAASTVMDGTEFGNITVATKFILQERCNYTWTAGLAATLPTADDAELFSSVTVNPSGGPLVRLENEAVNLHPFMAIYMKPREDTWVTMSTQLDMNVEGNSIISFPGDGRETVDKFNDQNLLSLDVSVGRWFFRDRCCSGRFINGMAGIWELHYTTTINDSDIVRAGIPGTDVLNNPDNRIDILNMTAGLRFQVGSNNYVTVSGVAPLRELEHKPFDAEFNLNFTRIY